MRTIDIVLIIVLIMSGIYLIYRILQNNSQGEYVETVDPEVMTEELMKYRSGIAEEFCNFIYMYFSNCPEEEIVVKSYNASPNRFIIYVALPINIIFTIEIDWHSHKYEAVAQYISETSADYKTFIYKTHGKLKSGDLVEFTKIQELAKKVNDRMLIETCGTPIERAVGVLRDAELLQQQVKENKTEEEIEKIKNKTLFQGTLQLLNYFGKNQKNKEIERVLYKIMGFLALTDKKEDFIKFLQNENNEDNKNEEEQ